eukprot:TRINITY_DN2904_c1_g7_i1.p1 TRINITY_DN2904_c1_g7~~TRINITY_DN2904_c1_g7_i1.p1  ORF type:complete len:776 (+),score=279.26 TRINITY_DN2904_c1_g7_i1:28-2355(+)
MRRYGGKGWKGAAPGGGKAGAVDDSYFLEDPAPQQQQQPPEAGHGGGDDEYTRYMEELRQAAARDAAAAGGGAPRYDPEELKEKDAVTCFLDHREKHAAYGKFHISSRDDEATVRQTAARAEETGCASIVPPKATAAPNALTPFRRALYTPPPVVAERAPARNAEYNELHGVTVRVGLGRGARGGIGAAAPALAPVLSWGHLGLTPAVVSALEGMKRAEPTVIQTYAVPAALMGMDVVAYAKTGAGKTLAYLLPMCIHVEAQGAPYGKQRGPGGAVLLPTRELAQQVYQEAQAVGKLWGLTAVPLYGGVDKTQQYQAARRGFDVAVAAPGRLLDLLEHKGVAMNDCTFIVIDECDALCSMGFAPDVSAILKHVRGDRQFMLLSATRGGGVDKMVTALTGGAAAGTPLATIEVGSKGESSAVAQRVEVVPNAAAKWEKLWTDAITEARRGSVVVFANAAECCESVVGYLAAAAGLGVTAAVLHGQMEQHLRTAAITAFKAGEANVLVATDVASRGLDIPAVKAVISFDLPRDIDTHLHRIGRAGRGLGVDDGVGISYFNLEHDRSMAKPLAQHLAQNQQPMPAALKNIAYPAQPAPAPAPSGSSVAAVNPLLQGSAPAQVQYTRRAGPSSTAVPAQQKRATVDPPQQAASDPAAAFHGFADASPPTPTATTSIDLPKPKIVLPPSDTRSPAADPSLPPKTGHVTIDLPEGAKEAPKVKMFGNRRLHEPLVGSAAAAAAAPSMPAQPAAAAPAAAGYQQMLMQQQQAFMAAGGTTSG